VMPWPSYPLYPLMAAHAGANPVPVTDRPVTDALNERTKAVVICNPNDPTGSYLTSSALRDLLSTLPEDLTVLLDEALIHFQDTEDQDACLRLVDDFPRLLVVRTFSKIYGLSGLRAGYAVSSDAHLLAAVAPVLGINEMTQAAVEYALRTGDAEIERRRQAVAREREVLTEQLRELGADVTDSQANFLWIRVRDMSGDQLANALRKQGVIVAPGGPLGEDHHIRAAIRDEPASNRLLRAVENLG
jgi:histidinol-phosphate aminotransferase